MRIWSDTTPTTRSTSDESRECRGGDCSRSTFDDGDLLYTRTTAQNLYTDRFQQVTPLHIRVCGNEHWLVCHASDSGRVIVMDAQALTLLEQFRTPTTAHEIMQNMMVSSSAVIEAGIAFFSYLGLLQNVEQSLHVPERKVGETLSAWLHVTNACTLRCSYCYLHKTAEQMAPDTARRAVDAVFRSATKHHFKHVLLKYAGGEASLEMANVLAIHEYATQLAEQHRINMRAYIMSNGVVLPQRYIEQLKARHIGIMISLDGVGAYHDSQRPFISGKGSFSYVDRTITRLLASRLIPHINVTVSQRNLEGLAGSD